jgi:hypothetical protein
MTYPNFSAGDVYRAADANAIGLWLVKSQAVGTGVSSVVVTGAFSADYDAYRIVYTGGTTSNANSDISLQLRAGGTTSTTGYYSSLIYWSGSAITAFNQDNTVSWLNTGGGSNTSARMYADVIGPFLAQPTNVFSPTPRNDIRGTTSGYHSVATSYDGFVFTPNPGTLTGGTIRVYGYKN